LGSKWESCFSELGKIAIDTRIFSGQEVAELSSNKGIKGHKEQAKKRRKSLFHYSLGGPKMWALRAISLPPLREPTND